MAAEGATGDAKPVRVAILGASGYTGAELVRMLLGHTGVEIAVLTGNTQAGQEFSAVFPQFHYAKVIIRPSRCCTTGTAAPRQRTCAVRTYREASKVFLFYFFGLHTRLSLSALPALVWFALFGFQNLSGCLPSELVSR